jgi:hypothetical protein
MVSCSPGTCMCAHTQQPTCWDIFVILSTLCVATFRDASGACLLQMNDDYTTIRKILMVHCTLPVTNTPHITFTSKLPHWNFMAPHGQLSFTFRATRKQKILLPTTNFQTACRSLFAALMIPQTILTYPFYFSIPGMLCGNYHLEFRLLL